MFGTSALQIYVLVEECMCINLRIGRVGAVSAMCVTLAAVPFGSRTRRTPPLEGRLVPLPLFSLLGFIIVCFSLINLILEQHRGMLYGITNRRWLPTSPKDPFGVPEGRVALAKVKGSVWQSDVECWEKAGCISMTSQNGCGFWEVNGNGLFLEKLGQKPVSVAKLICPEPLQAMSPSPPSPGLSPCVTKAEYVAGARQKK